MTATPTDPQVKIAALADALGVPVHALWRWQREGHIPRPAKGHAPLIAALRGALSGIRANVGPTPAMPAPAALPEPAPAPDLVGAMDRQIADLERALNRLRRRRPDPLRGTVTVARAVIDAELDGLMRRARAFRRTAPLILAEEARHGG